MAKAIKVTAFTRTGDSSFTAAGTCDDRPFLARTIVYRGEPIFKVQEADEDGKLSHLSMKDSGFDRGDRIAIARRLKQVRLGEAEGHTDFSQLTVKELRVKAQELSVEGWRDGGVRKAQLVALVQQAAS